MVWKSSWIALGVGMGLALGDAPRPPAPQPAKPKIIDLDFTGDDEDRAAGPGSAPDSESPRRWIGWTLGAGAAAAVAGGIGWYLFQERQEPETVRNESVFTDER